MIRKLLSAITGLVSIAGAANAQWNQWNRSDLNWGAFGYTQMAITSPKKGVGFIVSCQVRGTDAGKLSIETTLDTGSKATHDIDVVEYVVGSKTFSFRGEIRGGVGSTVVSLSTDPLAPDANSVYELVKELAKANTLTVRQSRLGISADFAVAGGATSLAGLEHCRSHYLSRSAAITPEAVAEEILIAARQSCLIYISDPYLMNASLSTAWWEPDAGMASGFAGPKRKVVGGWLYRRGLIELIALLTQSSDGTVSCLIAHKGQTEATFARLQTLVEQTLRVSNRSAETRNRTTVVDYVAQLNKAQRGKITVSHSRDDQQTWFQVTSR